MPDASDPRPADMLAERVETIEKAYEYMLAYAAQGRPGEDPQQAPSIRGILDSLTAELDGVAEAASARATASAGSRAAMYRPFIEVLADDARKAGAAVRAVLANPSIGSQLVDNLNASIHLRAVLTDIFVIDESLPPGGPADGE